MAKMSASVDLVNEIIRTTLTSSTLPDSVTLSPDLGYCFKYDSIEVSAERTIFRYKGLEVTRIDVTWSPTAGGSLILRELYGLIPFTTEN